MADNTTQGDLEAAQAKVAQVKADAQLASFAKAQIEGAVNNIGLISDNPAYLQLATLREQVDEALLHRALTLERSIAGLLEAALLEERKAREAADNA